MGSKRVFIHGTGFSKQAGMPLAVEMIPPLTHLFGESYARYDTTSMKAGISKVLPNLSPYETGIYPK